MEINIIDRDNINSGFIEYLPAVPKAGTNKHFGIAENGIWYYFIRMTTISLKIPDELISRIDALARARRTSRSVLLREAMEEKLKAVARRSPPSLYEQSADLCGMGNSGIGDLASNPKHLDGFGSIPMPA